VKRPYSKQGTKLFLRKCKRLDRQTDRQTDEIKLLCYVVCVLSSRWVRWTGVGGGGVRGGSSTYVHAPVIVSLEREFIN
jgi:hypothetical protein